MVGATSAMIGAHLKLLHFKLLGMAMLTSLIPASSKSLEARDTVEPLKVVLGTSRSAPERGTVVITRSGRVHDEEGLFPAISSDHQRIAILHVDDPHDRSFSLVLVNIETSVIERRLDLISADERNLLLGLNHSDLDEVDIGRRVRRQFELANQYLLENGFQAITSFYDMRQEFGPGPLFRKNGKLHRTWEEDIGRRSVKYDVVTGTLDVSDLGGESTQLRIRRPIEVYGIARPGVLCRVRPIPYQAWYDEESSTLIVRLGYLPGEHGCEVADRWLVRRLGSA